MAEDFDDAQKTEDPTPRRLDEARKRGEVAVSRELNHWFALLAATLAVVGLLPAAIRDIARVIVAYLEAPHRMALDAGALQSNFAGLLLGLGEALWPVIGLLALAGIGAGLMQTGPLLSAGQLKPKFSKISPAAGMHRLFSMQAAAEFAKGLAKLCVVGIVAWKLLEPEFDRLDRFIAYDVVQLADVISRLSVRLMAGVLAVLAVVAALDFIYQKLSFRRSLRMTRQEVRDEFRQSEGDPLIKSRLRQIRLERARRRMMQEVPKADVVITNPTHFAVALKYEQTKMGAPKVVAKGADRVAQRIREVAEEHQVPIVENPPLARALFASVDLDEEIPTEHYKAVAEVIGYVMKLRRARGFERRPNRD